ncbi:MAG TPA: substrate-binding domain-containing protein [Steroidobacteraceae bacterium]|jgi:hypothetical protein
MRNLTVAAAVAAALASAAASAAGNVDIYISGASAQKNFWYADLANIAGCAASSITGNKWAGPNTLPFTKPADLSYVQCTSTASAKGGIASGVTVTFHYSAELGSVWGVANALGAIVGAPYPVTHVFLANAGTCAPVPYVVANATYTGGGGANCGGALVAPTGQYDLYTTGGTDAMIGGNPAYVVTVQPDVDVADLEPGKFQFADNWPIANAANTWAPPLYKALGIQAAGTAPTVTQLNKIIAAKGASFVNGEVFAIITNFVGSGVTDPKSLSSNSLASILQGTYTSWNQVPEIGSAGDPTPTAISLVRRDHGSGSQIAASIAFTGTECGLPNYGGMAQDTGSGGPAVIAGSTSAMRTIVNATAGSIGYLSLTGNVPNLNETDNYLLENIDGAQPNAHNSAAGYYKFATQTWAYVNQKSPQLTVANLLITDAGTATGLSAVLGNETVTKGSDNRFSTAAGAEVGAYPLPGIASNTASTGNVNTLTNIPVALANNNGESCTVLGGTNGN